VAAAIAAIGVANVAMAGICLARPVWHGVAGWLYNGGSAENNQRGMPLIYVAWLISMAYLMAINGKQCGQLNGINNVINGGLQ